MSDTVESTNIEEKTSTPIVEEQWNHENPPIKHPTQLKTIFGISDVHTEFYDDAQYVFDSIKWPTTKFLVLAGDIGNPTKALTMLVDFLLLCKKRYQHVIYVPGNHEYYGCNFDRASVNAKLQEICDASGVVFLNGKSTVIDGVRFIGDTMWSIIDAESTKEISDFTQGVFANQIEYVSAFVDSYRFIQRELFASMDGAEPVVVVTHHLPTRRLVHPRFANFKGNSAFYTNVLDSMQVVPNCKLWFCGHTHEYGDTKLPNGKCIANPVGYPHETRFTKTHSTVYTIDDKLDLYSTEKVDPI